MAEDGHGDGWHPARLIPAMGIRGQEEQEKRATTSLLAVMRAVPELGQALLGPLGAPKGRVSTYVEVQLKDPAGKAHIPDGVVVVERGRTLWRCLVEVKTGSAELDGEQVNRYLDMAREHRFDAVLTISNQITSAPADSPVYVDRRKLRSVELVHLSWWRIITEAIVQHRHRGVSDPDQAWILGELIAYLDDERSGASGFQDMGENWVKVRDGAGDGTLRPTDADVRDVARRWDQFVEYLRGRTGRTSRPRSWPRPRQLIEASFANSKATTAALLGTARDDPQALLLPNDPKRPPRAFRLALSRPMGTKRGKGERSFVLETRKQAVDFYRELVQNLRAWRPSAPRLPDEPEEQSPPPQPKPPVFSSTDAREPTEGVAQDTATA